jgi:hemerythrin-like metal-binding protein
MPAVWHDSFSIGIPEIDGQHKKLLGLINDLESALLRKQGDAALRDIARRMQEYARFHFATEEKYMANARYPETGQHLDQHAVFCERATALSFSPDDPENHPLQVLTFLSDWLVTHIHGTDKKLGAYLQGM